MSTFKTYRTALLLIMLLPITYSKAQQLSQDPLYQLVFSDEFDSTAIRTQNWRTTWYWGYNMWNKNKDYTLCPGFPNDTIDYAWNTSPPNDTNRQFFTSPVTYQRMIFKKQNFNAPIIAYGHPCPSAICTAHNASCYTGGSGTECAYDSLVPFKFSGAMMLGKHKYKYGYIEMKFRYPNIANSPNNAYGPNLWMWSSDANAVYSEIDIFEQRGTDWKMDLNFHYRKQYTPTMNWQDTAFFHGKMGFPAGPTHPYLDYYVGPYNGGTWHTVGCEWTPEYIDTYYDSNDTIRRYSVTKLPVDKLSPMPLIIDNYTPAAQYCIPWNSGTTLPFTYDIDYVKVYQIKQVANCPNTSGNFLNTSSATYQSILYRDLTVGGVGGSAVFSSGTHHLAGDDFVIVQEGFEVSGTSTVIISTTPCQPDQAITYNINNPTGDLDSRIKQDMRTAKTHPVND